ARDEVGKQEWKGQFQIDPMEQVVNPRPDQGAKDGASTDNYFLGRSQQSAGASSPQAAPAPTESAGKPLHMSSGGGVAPSPRPLGKSKSPSGPGSAAGPSTPTPSGPSTGGPPG